MFTFVEYSEKMKRLFLIFAALGCIVSAVAQDIESSSHCVVGYVNKDGTIENSNHALVGYFKSDGTIEDNSHGILGFIKQDGTIFLIDFEQATKEGDKAWDIAVFLYYSGHYLEPFYTNGKAESVAKAFIEGYLKGGGSVNNVKKAGAPKYTRVFSIFTIPPAIRAISDVCKKTEPIKEKAQ